MTTTIRPMQDRVLVKAQPREEKTSGGIFIPTSAREDRAMVYATVVAVGPGKMTDHGRLEPHVKNGDMVIVGKYAGTKVMLDEVEHVMVRESDIEAVVE